MVSYFSGVCCDSLKLRGCPLYPTGRSLFYLAALWLTESLETKLRLVALVLLSTLLVSATLSWNIFCGSVGTACLLPKLNFLGSPLSTFKFWLFGIDQLLLSLWVFICHIIQRILSLFFNVVTFPDTAKFFFSTAKFFFLFLIFVCVISVKFFQEGKETEGFHLPSWNQKPGRFLDFYFRRNIFYYYFKPRMFTT